MSRNGNITTLATDVTAGNEESAYESESTYKAPKVLPQCKVTSNRVIRDKAPIISRGATSHDEASEMARQEALRRRVMELATLPK